MDNIKEKLKERAESKEDALQRLYDIVKILRKECPWDREQNHDSLRQGSSISSFTSTVWITALAFVPSAMQKVT